MTPDELRQAGVRVNLDLARLKALADGATQGPWKTEGSSVHSVATGYIMETSGGAPTVGSLSSPRGPDQRDRDAAYIAALSPDVVTELIARVERAEAALREIAAHKTMDELEAAGIEQYVDESDFVTDFAGCVTTARAALAALEAS